MADTEKKFSELTAAAVLTDADILAISQIDSATASLMSKRTTLIAIANKLASLTNYTSELTTQDKTLTGAINELKGLISLIPHFGIEVVQTLPTEDISETTIYMTPSQNPQTQDAYDEFIYVNDAWEHVGSTAVDLSAYYTKLETDALLATKANSADVAAALEQKESTADMEEDVTDIVVDLTDTQETAEGNPVTLQTVQEGYAKAALVTFTPEQSGSGDPSPENIRPITVYDTLTLTVSDGDQQEDEYTATFPYTVASGSYDFATGEGTGTEGNVIFDGSMDETWSLQSINSYGIANFAIVGNNIKQNIDQSLCNILIQQNSIISQTQGEGFLVAGSNTLYLRIKSTTASTVSELRTWLSNNNTQIVYPFTTPIPITLTPAYLKLNKGTNTITTDGDSVKVKYNKLALPDIGGIGRYISALEARVAALEGNGNRSLSLMKSAPIESKEAETTEAEAETEEKTNENTSESK